MSEPKKRKENVNVKKENNMGHGIGPQNLGAPGMSAKSKPCGSPLDFNKELRAALPEIRKKNPGFAEAIEADTSTNYGTPLDFQDDIAKIQDAASTLEAHNIGSGGEMQGASSAAQENAAAQLAQVQQSISDGNTGVSGPLAGRITDIMKRRR